MDKPLLRSTQPIELRTKNEVLAYINMWKSVCRKGIKYRDMFTYPVALPLDEKKLERDENFLRHKQGNSNKDFEMREVELQLIEALKKESSDAYNSYITLQSKASQHLLHLTDVIKESTEKLISYVTEIKNLATTHPKAKAWLNVLEKHKLVTGTQINEAAFCRYAFYLKLQFVIAAGDLLLQNASFFKEEASNELKNLGLLLLKDCDLDTDALNNLLPPKLILPQTDAPSVQSKLLSTDKVDYQKEYNELSKELGKINKDLKEKVLGYRSDTWSTGKELIFEDIDKLKAKKEALTYVMEKHLEKTNLINRAEASAKNWISSNLFDKKKAGKDAAKVFFSTTGSTIANAIFYSLSNQSHKIDPEKVRKEILTGLLETGLTALGTYFLGPLGGSFTQKVMSFFREEPVDPYLEEFKAIKNQISEGFGKVENKLNEISSQITAELNAAVNKLEASGELTSRKQTFLVQKDKLIATLKNIDKLYENIYLNRGTQIDEAELSKLDKDFQAGLIKLCSIFYHDDFDFDLKAEISAPSDNSLCGMFIKYNHQASVSFHFTARNLLNICGEIANLGQTYLALREKWFALLSTTLLFFKGGKTTDTNQLFHIYWNAHKDSENFTANLTIELDALKLYVVGFNNIALLQNIERALNSNQIDFLGGVGLENVPQKANEKAQLYEYNFDDDCSAKGRFVLQANRQYLSRYVVAGFTLESQAKSYYKVYSQQNNQVPVPIHVHLRILPNDTLGILNVENNDYHIARVINPTSAEEFSESIEAFFGKQASMHQTATTPASETRFSLPIKDHYLSIKVENRTDVTFKIYRLVQGRDKPVIIHEYQHRIQLIEFYQGTPEGSIGTPWPFFVLKPVQNEKQALIEIISFDTLNNKQGKTSIILSDYDAMRKAGMSRGIDSVSTYNLKMKHKNREIDVRTDNIRPFISNLLLAGDQFEYKSEERNNFGVAVEHDTKWKSLNGAYSLHANNHNSAWYIQLLIFKDGSSMGLSVFGKYRYSNKYSGHICLQSDGNFVMYDSDQKAIAATDTQSVSVTPPYVQQNKKFAYLNNEGDFVVVDILTKELKKFKNASPTLSTQSEPFRGVTNQLLVGQQMRANFDYRIESENGAYYAEFFREEIESGHWYITNDYEFSLALRKRGGELVKKVLYSSHISKGNVYPSTYLIMQSDGNLVAYNQQTTNNKFGKFVKKESLFASGTNAAENEGCVLCITNDGKLFLAHTGQKIIVKWLAE